MRFDWGRSYDDQPRWQADWGPPASVAAEFLSSRMILLVSCAYHRYKYLIQPMVLKKARYFTCKGQAHDIRRSLSD